MPSVIFLMCWCLICPCCCFVPMQPVPTPCTGLNVCARQCLKRGKESKLMTLNCAFIITKSKYVLPCKCNMRQYLLRNSEGYCLNLSGIAHNPMSSRSAQVVPDLEKCVTSSQLVSGSTPAGQVNKWRVMPPDTFNTWEAGDFRGQEYRKCNQDLWRIGNICRQRQRVSWPSDPMEEGRHPFLSTAGEGGDLPLNFPTFLQQRLINPQTSALFQRTLIRMFQRPV